MGQINIGFLEPHDVAEPHARVQRRGNEATATVWGMPTGLWVIQTSGASAHTIPKRKPTKRRPRPMKGAGYEHPIQMKQIQHPGTHGLGAWTRVRKRSHVLVPEVFRDEVHRAVSRG